MRAWPAASGGSRARQPADDRGRRAMSRVTEAAVLNALRPIQDPDFRKSIVDLGFIKELRIEGSHVAFSIELTTPACPVKERFQQEARDAVLALDGVDSVDVNMTASTRGSRPTERA